jgi:hypothetical protein
MSTSLSLAIKVAIGHIFHQCEIAFVLQSRIFRRKRATSAGSSPALHSSARTSARAPPPHAATMIKGIMIVNNHGKPRIVKFYEHVVRVFARRLWTSHSRRTA